MPQSEAAGRNAKQLRNENDWIQVTVVVAVWSIIREGTLASTVNESIRRYGGGARCSENTRRCPFIFGRGGRSRWLLDRARGDGDDLFARAAAAAAL